jgi:S1-C subfamily serine protease
VSERVQPLVVHVDAIVRINDRRDSVTASGLIASRDGLVLTNHHVVHRADKVEVHVQGRKAPFPARILGSDPQTDIALLRIEPGEPLPEPVFGRAEDVRVGQWVLAIGNPYGLEGTVSLGIVSAKGRNLDVPDLLNEFIQTDAMIDRGSSGGPLVDLEGRVIGLNSRGQGRGIGFTIPIDTVLQVQRQIAAGGVERGWIGITLQPLSRDLAAYFGIPDVSGVIVNGVSPGSPAAHAKLAPGDVITHFDGKAVEAEQEEDLGDFQRRVAGVPPGRTVVLSLLRAGKAREVRVELGTQPTVQPEESETGFGFHVQEITEKLFREQRLESREGAYVSFVARGSAASEAGLFPGDVVERIDDQRVRDLAELRRALEGVEEKPSFLITARRGGDLKFLLVKQGVRPAAPAAGGEDPGEAAHGP